MLCLVVGWAHLSSGGRCKPVCCHREGKRTLMLGSEAAWQIRRYVFLPHAYAISLRSFASQIGIAVAIIVIVYYHLTNYIYIIQNKTTTYQCLLGKDDQGNDLCTYSWATSGISLVLSIYLASSVCCTCKCWAFVELWLDWIVVVGGALLWAALGVVLAYYNENQVSIDVQENWRRAVVILAWVNFLLFALDALGTTVRVIVKICQACCTCCGTCCGGKKKDQGGPDVESNSAPSQQYMSGGSAAANINPPPQPAYAKPMVG